MNLILQHLPILPIILPLLAGAAILLIDEKHKNLKAVVSLTTAVLLIITAYSLLQMTDNYGDKGWTGVYLLGNWSPVFGIVLVADRISALMVLLTSVLATCALLYSTARWHKSGPHFHTFFLLLLVGVNGAFLTGDLFNLFVFFEIMLCASYALLLQGNTIARVKSGLHYIAINLISSSLFLIGVSLIYGVTGTLNMAELAMRVSVVSSEDRMLLEVGAAILGTSFLTKAGMWPLSFWLPTAYSAAAAPVAAMFAIMSKVGIYVIFRLSLLVFGHNAGASAFFGVEWLIWGGIATIIFGSAGVLASQGMGRLAGYSVLVSTGTLLLALSFETPFITGSALYYLIGSTLGISAFFMLIELVDRGRVAGADVLAVTMEAYGDDLEEDETTESDDVGIPVPVTLALLGISFIIVALQISAMPPMPGFVAKLGMITGMFNPSGIGVTREISTHAWVVSGLLIVSGFASLVAMARAGINTFWATLDDTVPRVNIVEILPVIALISLCFLMAIFAGPIMAYLNATAAELHNPISYIQSVINAEPIGVVK